MKQLAAKLLDKIVPFLILAALVAAYQWGPDLWWELTIGRQMEQANRFIVAQQPEKALPLVRAALRDHPKDAHLLYLASGVYIQMGRPFAADVVLSAYEKVAADSDNEKQSLRFTRARQFHDQIISGHMTPLLDPTYGVTRQEPGPGNFLDLLNKTIEMYNHAPATWRKQVKDYSFADLLSSPVDGPDAALGLVNPQRMLDAGIVCRKRENCSPHFSEASLTDAIASGRLAINAPEAGAGCCAVSLDDPDLRPVDDIMASILTRRTSGGSAVDKKSDADTLNRTLGIYSRAALKHMFVFNFIENAK